MSIASWFPVPQLHRAPAPSKPGRQSSRRPIHSRPCLEELEARTLLDASSGLLGGINNLSFNGGLASNGVILPLPTSGEHSASVSGIDASGRSADTASDALFAQDQPNAQRRLFGVNSQGEGIQFFQQATANILRDAYGFGSGTQPNAPWMPNAYNLGLANHQFGYPSQTDLGFSSVPPWYHTAQAPPDEQSSALDREHPAADAAGSPANSRQTDSVSCRVDEEKTELPEQSAQQRSLREQEQSQQDKRGNNVDDNYEQWKMPQEQPEHEKLSLTERAVSEEDGIPDSLWLSALAPAPMAALVAGLPGMAVATEDGDAGTEAEE